MTVKFLDFLTRSDLLQRRSRAAPLLCARIRLVCVILEQIPDIDVPAWYLARKEQLIAISAYYQN